MTSCATTRASAANVHSFGKITTGSDFYAHPCNTNVMLNTAIVPLNSGAFDNKCTTRPFTDGSDLRVQGAGLGTTTPTTYMLLVIPKETIKKAGITSRNAASYNVCLGALWIESDPAHPIVKWKTKSGRLCRTTSTRLIRSGIWGTPGDCGAATLTATDPCIALRTKQVPTSRPIWGYQPPRSTP